MKVVLVDMDRDVSKLKESAVIVGVASSVGDASTMISRPDIDVVLLSDNIYDFLQKISSPVSGQDGVKSSKPKKITLDGVIEQMMSDLGLSSNLQGYYNLKEALKYTANCDYMPMLTKELFIHVSKVCGSPSNGHIERNIRSMLRTRWGRTPTSVRVSIFGSGIGSLEVAPTLSECIATLTNYIKSQIVKYNVDL